MITCRDFADLVTTYLEQELALGQRASFRLHAALCRDCSTYLSQMQLTVDELANLREGTPDAATRAKLLEAFHARSRS